MADSYHPEGTITSIEELLHRQPEEGRTLEYKRDLPGSSRGEKKELLADVTSFANTLGGHLLFGIGEEAGLPIAAPGIAVTNLDDLRLRFENLVRDGVSPPVRGLSIYAIALATGAHVLVVRIPRSFSRPHMITLGGSSRFFCRNSAGKYPLDVVDLRRLFLESETLADRINSFQLDRISRIVSGETTPQLSDAGKIILHFVPYSAFDLGQRIELGSIISLQQHYHLLQPIHEGASSSRYTLDGFLKFANDASSGECLNYLLVFQTGCLETVESYLLRDRGNDRTIPSSTFEHMLIRACERYQELLPILGVAPPVAVLLSLVGVRGFRMAVSSERGEQIEKTRIDRDTVLIPPVILEEFGVDTATLIRPLLDSVWNAAGWDRSRNYDLEGRWTSG